MGVPSQADLRSPSLYEEMDFIANVYYTPSKDRHKILDLPIVKTLVWLKWQNIKLTFWAARFFQVITLILNPYHFSVTVTVLGSWILDDLNTDTSKESAPAP
jgi:hypothetical protein